MPVSLAPSRHSRIHIVAGAAARRHGVVTFAELIEAGCSEDAIQWMVTTGHLHRRHRGVYAVGHTALSREGRWSAAVLAGGDGAALSHVSAAQFWGITRRTSERIHVSTPRYRRPIAGVTSHHLRPLQDDALRAVTSRDGIRATTVTRTIIDLAEIMDAEELAFVMHEAAFRFVLDVDEIRRVIAENARFRGRGVLREALEMHLSGRAGARSRFEERVRTYLEGRGYPKPAAGYPLQADDGTYELDMAWPACRVNVEADGGRGHARPRSRRKDRERDQAIRRAGWHTYRVSSEAFDADPATATHELRAALDEGLRRTP